MISARFKEIHALLQDATAAAKKAGDKEYGIVSQLRLICDELEIKADASEIAENLLHSQMADYLKVIEEDVSRVLRDLSRLSSGYDTSYFRQVMERDLRTLRINLYLVKSRIPVPYTDPSGGYSVSELASIIEWPAFLRLYNLSDANFLFESGYFGKQDKDNYDSLDESQKKCLLCLAIFPEEAEIQKRLLRIWWAAEGFVTLDHVDEILDIFVNRGFIEPVYKKGGRQASSSFKMHPLTRSLVIKLAQRAGFFDFELDAKLTDCRSRRACLAEETCLSYDEKEQQITNLKKLKALFNISKEFLDFQKSLFSQMSGVNVLYLGRWETRAEQRHIEVEKTDFLEGLKMMKNLRLLSLKGICGINEIPPSLCNLTNLLILDLRECYNLEKLPTKLGSSLNHLIYLDLSGCYLLNNMPILNSQLQILKGFMIGETRSSSAVHRHLKALTKLKLLKNLSINVHNDHLSMILIQEGGPILSQFKLLEKLKIEWLTNRAPQSRFRTRREKGAAAAAAAIAITGKFVNLVKLELECYPVTSPPTWVAPEMLPALNKLYIRGGTRLNLGEISVGNSNNKWNVEALILKYSTNTHMTWKQLRTIFPELKVFQRFKCPGITWCPCDVDGVWLKSSIQNSE